MKIIISVVRKGEYGMASQTVELLKECNSGCKMAINSMEQIMEYVQDKKQGEIIRSNTQKHRSLEDKISRQLLDNDAREEQPGIMASAMSWLSTEMKMSMHNDSNQVAKIMMDGCNMGIQSLSEYLNKYTEASKESRDLAEELIKVEENFMEEMKQFL